MGWGGTAREKQPSSGDCRKGKRQPRCLKKTTELLKTPRERDILKSTTCSATLLGYFYIFMSVEQTTIYLPGFFGCKTIGSGHKKQDGAEWFLQPQSGRVGGLGEGLLGQKAALFSLFSPSWPSTELKIISKIIGEVSAALLQRGKK